MVPDRGRFIVIEGIDGSGSTSQGSVLTTSLRAKRKRVAFTHEPTEGPVGGLIRLALSRRLTGAPSSAYLNGAGQDRETPGLDPETLALLYAADRRDHTMNAIDPNLANGTHVISDRYLLSSLAYQGLNVEVEWLLHINEFARRPDLTIFLDLSVEQALLRMKAARWTRDLFEEEAGLQRVYGKYRELIASDIPQLGPIVRVDASRPKEEVARRIRTIVFRFLEFGEYAGEHTNPSLFDLQLTEDP